MSSAPGLDRRAFLAGSLGAAAALVSGCTAGSTTRTAPAPSSAPAAAPAPGATPPPATSSTRPRPGGASAVAARATVPVLCWHQLRDWRRTDGASSRRFLICPPKNFRAQLDALAEDGWTAIDPDRYLAHLTTGAVLPAKPVVLSFDDSQGTQVSEGLPQLRRRDMTGTFFCMTIVLDKPGWMSRDDLRRLGDAGMTVAAHSYDHRPAHKYRGRDFRLQFDGPRELLEGVLRRPVEHFAYPYGAWARLDFAPLRAAGYRTAFQLSDEPLDRSTPLYTLRRILVDSTWTGPDLLRQLSRPV